MSTWSTSGPSARLQLKGFLRAVSRGKKDFIDRLEAIRSAAAPKTLPSAQRYAALPLDEMNADSWHHLGTTSGMARSMGTLRPGD